MKDEFDPFGHMSVLELIVLLKESSRYREDTYFCDAIRKEINTRSKPKPKLPTNNNRSE